MKESMDLSINNMSVYLVLSLEELRNVILVLNIETRAKLTPWQNLTFFHEFALKETTSKNRKTHTFPLTRVLTKRLN